MSGLRLSMILIYATLHYSKKIAVITLKPTQMHSSGYITQSGADAPGNTDLFL